MCKLVDKKKPATSTPPQLLTLLGKQTNCFCQKKKEKMKLNDLIYMLFLRVTLAFVRDSDSHTEMMTNSQQP